MKEILKPMFEFVFDQLQLFENPIYNYIVMAIIGTVAFKIAWEVSPGGRWGSLIHWTVRILAVVMLFTIISGIIWLISLIITIPMWIWILVVISLVIYLFWSRY